MPLPGICYKYVAVEGCIGAGKTELVHRLHADLGGGMLLEQFAENKFLPLFYQNPEMYAFHLELAFLTDRYAQVLALQEVIKEGRILLFADYFFDKSYIFSFHNLRGDELLLYQKLFAYLQENLQKPDIVLYLYKTPEALQRNIKKRGRSYEQNIEKSYLYEIQEKYLDYLKTWTAYPVLIVNTEALDFVGDLSDYLLIKDLLSKEYDPKNHYLLF